MAENFLKQALRCIKNNNVVSISTCRYQISKISNYTANDIHQWRDSLPNVARLFGRWCKGCRSLIEIADGMEDVMSRTIQDGEKGRMGAGLTRHYRLLCGWVRINWCERYSGWDSDVSIMEYFWYSIEMVNLFAIYLLIL